MEKISIIDEKDLENNDIPKILRASIKKLKKRWSPLFPLAILGDISRPIGLFPNLKGLDLCGFSEEEERDIDVLKKKNLKIYTTEWCGDCHVLKRYFSQQKVHWNSLDIDFDEDSLKEVLLVSLGRRVIPTLDYGDFVLINPSLQILRKIYE